METVVRLPGVTEKTQVYCDETPWAVRESPLYIHRTALNFLIYVKTGRPRVLGVGSSGLVIECQFEGTSYAAKIFSDTKNTMIIRDMQRSLTLPAHPNIISVLGFTAVELEPDTFRWCLITELCETTLNKRLRAGGDSILTRLTWAKQVLSAVSLLHSKCIIHGDIKSDNVLMKDNETRLTDFGLSHERPEDEIIPVGSDRWNSLKAQGTPTYMAPEVMMRTSLLSPVTDVFSCGVLLWECATGKTPYSGEEYRNVSHFQRCVIRGARPAKPEQLAELPPGLGDLIAAMWGPEAGRPSAARAEKELTTIIEMLEAIVYIPEVIIADSDIDMGVIAHSLFC